METRKLKRYPIGNPRRAWRQDRFILSTFRGITGDIRTGLESLKEAHFNLVEFGWVPSDMTDDAINIAEEVGMDVLVQDWRTFGGFQNTRSTEIEPQKFDAFFEKMKKYRHVYGYYVWDEPLYDADIEKAARQTNAVTAKDPERMPFTVAIPSYNTEYTYRNDLFDAYLERFVTKIDPPVLSLDYYPMTAHPRDDKQLDDCNVYKDLYLMRKWSLSRDLPLWFYYQGTPDLGECTLTTRQIDEQVHLALLYGAKGLQHYTVVGPVINEDGTPGDYFDHIRNLHIRMENWGRTLMALTSTGVFHSADVLAGDATFRSRYCDDFAESRFFEGALPIRISLGEFTDAYGNDYAMILNRDYIHYFEGDLPLKGSYRVYEISDKNGKQSIIQEAADSLKAALKPGGAMLIRLQKVEEAPFTIEYQLEK